MKSLSKLFLEELEREAANTRKMLERVPVEKGDWQPHEKSFPIGRLATHIAEIPGWMSLIISADELDFGNMKYTPPVVNTNEDLLKVFQENLDIAKKELANADDSKYDDKWSMRHGDQVYFTLPRHEIVRSWVLNHVVHHRAQLGVYLRLMDIPVPGMYGPTADDQNG